MNNTQRIATLTCISLVGLAGCDIKLGGLSGKKIEQNIREGLEEEDIEVDEIECPDSEKDEDGNEFKCKGKTASGTKFKIEVEAKGGGSIKWELVGRIQDTHKLEKELKGKLGNDYDCGADGETIIATKGVEVVCKSDKDKHTITFTDNDGGHEIDSEKR